jgi:hypothetical protein
MVIEERELQRGGRSRSFFGYAGDELVVQGLVGQILDQILLFQRFLNASKL